jgi:hypothetical protein
MTRWVQPRSAPEARYDRPDDRRKVIAKAVFPDEELKSKCDAYRLSLETRPTVVSYSGRGGRGGRGAEGGGS